MAASLPFGPVIPNLAIGLVAGLWLVQLLSGRCQADRNAWIGIILLSAYTLFCWSTYFYSSNTGYFFKKATLQTMIVLFAVVFFTIPHKTKRITVYRVLRGFIYGNTLMALLSMGRRLFEGLGGGGLDLYSMTFNELATSVGSIHYLSLSLYVSFAIAAGVYQILTRRVPRGERLLLRASLLLLAIFLFLLGSRTAIMATLLATGAMFAIRAIRQRRYGRLLLFLLVIALGGFAGSRSSLAQQKWKEIYQYDQFQGSAYWGGTGMRVLIWDCALKVMANNPVWGVGVGDDLDELTLCYKVYQYNQLLVQGNNFHAHNIFLQAGVRAGWLGLIVLLVSLLFTVWNSYRNKNWLYLLFVSIFLFCGLTESYFQVNAGVLFFAFFAGLLYSFKPGFG
jgi:O-antigen ligase